MCGGIVVWYIIRLLSCIKEVHKSLFDMKVLAVTVTVHTPKNLPYLNLTARALVLNIEYLFWLDVRFSS